MLLYILGSHEGSRKWRELMDVRFSVMADERSSFTHTFEHTVSLWTACRASQLYKHAENAISRQKLAPPERQVEQRGRQVSTTTLLLKTLEIKSDVPDVLGNEIGMDGVFLIFRKSNEIQ